MQVLSQEVKVTALVNNKKVIPDNTGLIGYLSPRSRIVVHIGVPASGYYAFTCDAKGNIQGCWPEPLIGEGPEYSVFTLRIKVKMNGSKTDVQTGQGNHVRLLKLLEDGRYALWDIGVCSQRGGFFLLSIPSESGKCYRKGDTVVFPERPRPWPQLEDFVRCHITPCSLCDEEEYRPEPQKPQKLGSNEAEVLWFNPFQGKGLARLKDGTPVHIRWKKINSLPPRVVMCGDIIRYERVVPRVSSWVKQGEPSIEFTRISVVR